MKKIKTENKLLIMLAFFSISVGLWTNFKQLWLETNGLIVSEISNILSLGTFLCIIGLIVTAKHITLDRLKNFIASSLLLKVIIMFLLFLINGTNNTIFLKILIILDIIIERLIILSIYPFLTTIIKDDDVFSKRKLTEYLFKDVGILIGGLIIGKSIFSFNIDYNVCLFIALIFMILAFIVMCFIQKPKIPKTSKNKTGIIKYLLNNKILIIYFIYYMLGHMALNISIGLKMLTMTNYMNFTPKLATDYFLIIGLAADIIGFMCLKFFTFKNDYINISIKFIIRFSLYVIAFLSNNILIAFIALTWSLLISTAYENRTDAPYINSVYNEFQLIYADIRFVFGIIGEAIGLFLCGIMYEIGLRYMFGLSAFFMIFQIALAFYLIYLRNKQKESIH